MRLPSRIPSLPSRISFTSQLSLGSLGIGRRSGPELVGLDIQPGFVAAVKAHVNGSIVADQAAALPLPPDSVRDGEVFDDDALAEALRELFGRSGLGKRVRVGVANQRTVLRTLELPPVTDPKELAAAVGFQAQEQVPMPLGNAVMDFHPLGVADTPSGPRQRVVLVAAQRDMIERLIGAVRRAGLTVDGFVPPAWSMPRWLVPMLAERGYRFTEDHTHIYDPQAGTSRPSVVLNFASRTPSRLLASVAYCRLARPLARALPARVAMHPADMRFALLRRETRSLLAWASADLASTSRR